MALKIVPINASVVKQFDGLAFNYTVTEAELLPAVPALHVRKLVITHLRMHLQLALGVSGQHPVYVRWKIAGVDYEFPLRSIAAATYNNFTRKTSGGDGLDLHNFFTLDELDNIWKVDPTAYIDATKFELQNFATSGASILQELPKELWLAASEKIEINTRRDNTNTTGAVYIELRGYAIDRDDVS